MSEVMTPDEINGLIERLQVDMNYLRRSDRAEMAQIGRDIEDAAFGLQRAQHQIVTAVSSITELTAEVERLREVLEPFGGAAAGELFSRNHNARDVVFALSVPWGNVPVRITAGDFFRARAALSHEEGK
jgi:hypothetical protein